MLWLAQEELSEGVREAEGVSRREMTSQILVNQSACQVLVYLHGKGARLFIWDMSCERFFSWQKSCLFEEEA